MIGTRVKPEKGETRKLEHHSPHTHRLLGPPFQTPPEQRQFSSYFEPRVASTPRSFSRQQDDTNINMRVFVFRYGSFCFQMFPDLSKCFEMPLTLRRIARFASA